MSDIKDAKFKEYESIDHAKGNFLSKYPDGQYAVTEKVHGSNFQFTTNGTVVKNGKRSAYISDTENFYNSSGVIAKWTPNVLQLHAKIAKPGQWITVFGELFGGAYPEHKTEGKPIQRGIFYCPYYDFYAFDIYEHENKSFLDLDIAHRLFEEFKFVYAKPLLIGTKEEVVAFEYQKLQSTIWKNYGLKELKDNIAEGIVIRSVKGHIILKRVTKKFRETIKNPNLSKHDVKEFAKMDFAAVMATSKEDILRYVTKIRLSHVMSKTEVTAESQLVSLKGHLTADALKDFIKDNEPIWNMLEKKDRKEINSVASLAAHVLVTKHKSEILAGTFDPTK